MRTRKRERKEAETLRKTAEQGRVSAEEARVSAEGDRTRAEEARMSAEAERVKAEQARTEIEITRQTNELTRKDNESRRVTAEKVREIAEEGRINAEINRVNTETKRDDAETNRKSAESTRVATEESRKEAEAVRERAEQARMKAEKSRETKVNDATNALDTHKTAFDAAESLRVQSEKDRKEAEALRVQAESGRVQAEKERVAADEKRDDATNKAIKAAETATAGAEKVNATLTEGNIFEVTGRTGVKKTLDMSGLVSAQSDVARIQESMGAYSDRPDITLVAKETNKSISADGVKVTKAGWAIAEFTAELGNIYLFNPGETSSDVCVFAEYIDKVETRAIDYAYTYDESGRVLTAKATYNGKTYTYAYDYSTDETVITDQDNNKVSSLPSVYTTTVGAYNPMTILNTDAELPQDGFCRFVSNFTTASSIKIVVSYKIASANLTMKVVRDGSTANMCSQLAKINKKVDDIAERQIPKSKLLIHTCKEGCVIQIDSKDISLETRKNYFFENFRIFSFLKVKEAINRLCISNTTYCNGRLFFGLVSLTSLTFNNYTPKTIDMIKMFDGCSSLTSIDVSGWDTSKVIDMSYMFNGCSSLTSIDVSGWDTNKVTKMNNMFNGCSSLTNFTFGENFGKMQDVVGTLDLSAMSAWKNDSVKSLLTLYDRKANALGVITIKLHANTKNVLGEDGIAQLTEKGYIIA